MRPKTKRLQIMLEINKNKLPDFNGKDPFKVPEGYFDTLTARIMEQIPSQDAKLVAITARPKRRTYLRWAAVSLATIGIGLSAYVFYNQTNQQVGVQNEVGQTLSAQMPAGDEIDQMADYIMLDHEDYYAYLTE